MQQILNGVVVGSVYALFSLGFNLVFGTAHVLNLAHGAMFTWGAFAGLYAVEAGVPIYLALPLAMLLGGLLGVVLEFIVFRQLRKRGASEFTTLVASIGAGLILVSLAQQASDTQVLRFPFGVFPVVIYQFFGLRLSLQQLVIMGSVAIFVVGLIAYIYGTSFGRQLRALSVNERTARLLGVNPQPVYLQMFFISGALAGAAGLMIGLAFNTVQFLMGDPYMLRAFVIVVIGGMGSMHGAVAAGFLVGIIQTLTTAFGLSALTDAILFGLLFLVLLVRPNGLFSAGQVVTGPR
jgi:branched-chain amino acid transport system permease protein